jgi:TolB protein
MAVALTAALAIGGAGAAAAASRPGAASGRTELAAGQVGSRSGVPWRHVGPGWVLAQYWPGRAAFEGRPVAAAATLYLIDPAGGRYRIYRWPATTSPPVLVDWSGDKSRALLQSESGTRLEQVVLATGHVRDFRLAAGAEAIGYTRPRGRGLLGWQQVGSRVRLARYSLTGHLGQILITGSGDYTAVYSPGGAALAVAGASGLQLVGSNGGTIRILAVPGTGPGGCLPARWWNPATILASCDAGDSSRGRLWLVPASGARPAPLTPQRGARSRDPGDVGAWRLPGGLYLRALGSAGRWSVFRQAPDGRVTPVAVPGTAGDNSILTARGSRLLLSAASLCYPGTSLLWFSPSAHREQVLLKPPRGRTGVLGAVPYGLPLAAISVGAGCGEAG